MSAPFSAAAAMHALITLSAIFIVFGGIFIILRVPGRYVLRAFSLGGLCAIFAVWAGEIFR